MIAPRPARALYRELVIDYEWRGGFGNGEFNRLHAEGFDHRLLDEDSLGWVCARRTASWSAS